MKKSLILILLLISAGIANGGEAQQSAEDFALHVKDIVASRNIEGFRNLPRFPRGQIHEDEINYVFGLDGQEGFVDFLNEDNVKVKLYGPHSRERLNNISFTVIYYDPEKVQFNENGYVDRELIGKLWGKGFLEIVITRFDDGCNWGFHRSVFYYGAHAPWVEDY